MLIVDCKAQYDRNQMMVQVLGIVTDENENNLAPSIKDAEFQLVFNDTIQERISVPRESYVVPASPHESGEGWEFDHNKLGEFRAFFLNYPRSSNLQVRWRVELLDGRKAEAVRPVLTSEEEYEFDVDNPMLGGRVEPNWKKIAIRDFERPQ